MYKLGRPDDSLLLVDKSHCYCCGQSATDMTSPKPGARSVSRSLSSFSTKSEFEANVISVSSVEVGKDAFQTSCPVISANYLDLDISLGGWRGDKQKSPISLV